MKPKIYVVGFGPGERPYMTQQAADAMTQADLVVGYTACWKSSSPNCNIMPLPCGKKQTAAVLQWKRH